MDNNHCDMRGAGGKGFLPAISRGDLEDGGDDEDVGDKNQAHRDQDHQHTYDQSQDLIGSGVDAGEFHHRSDVTEEVSHLGGTEGQPEHS